MYVKSLTSLKFKNSGEDFNFLELKHSIIFNIDKAVKVNTEVITYISFISQNMNIGKKCPSST